MAGVRSICHHGFRSARILRRSHESFLIRCYQSTTAPEDEGSLSVPLLWTDAVVRVRGDLPYGSREYLLLPRHITLADITSAEDAQRFILASLRAHRNILFGAKLHSAITKRIQEEPKQDMKQEQMPSLAQVCPVLVHDALVDATSNGEQPQALATMHGLCDWVKQQLLQKDNGVTNNVFQNINDFEMEAVRAIATGIPRPGHSVVGAGTYRDGEQAWTQLAKQFAATGTADECQLYQIAGVTLVQIEPLADTQPVYLQSAGGAMARFVFL